MAAVIRLIAAAGAFKVEPVPPDARPGDLEPPGGVYAAFATWNARRVIRLGAHFDRLEDSARRLGFSILLDRSLVAAQLCAMMDEAGFDGAKFRLSAHPSRWNARLAVAMEPYSGLDPELRASGVRCRTVAGAARAEARAKQTSWLAARSRLREADDDTGIYEYLLLDDSGAILEGTSSNFYAIVNDADGSATLRTASERILHGIARSIVLEVAPARLPVDPRPVSIEDLPLLAEAFITSSSRGIVPVISIDGTRMGDGRPGPWTAGLLAAYDARAAELEEALCAEDA